MRPVDQIFSAGANSRPIGSTSPGLSTRFHPRFVDTLVAIPDIIGSTPDRDSSKIRLNSV